MDGAQAKRIALVVLLTLGLLIRLPFVLTGFHLARDIETYIGWGRVVRTRGLADAYSDPKVSYPPLLLYLFGGAVGLASTAHQGEATTEGADRMAAVLIQLPTVVADVLIAGLLAWVFWRRAPAAGLLAAGLYLFNPAVWYVTALWGQTDSIYALFLVASLVALERKAVLPAWILYALALATKVQSLALAPLMIVGTLARDGSRRAAAGLLAGVAVVLALLAPWIAAGRLDDVLAVYTVPPEKVVVSSAYNGWYLFLGGNLHLVQSDLHPTNLPLSYQDFGNLLFALLAILVVWAMVRRGSSLALAAAALSLALFVVFTQMHERHAFPALAFLAWASAEQLAREPAAGRRPGIGWIYGLLTLTLLFNLITVVPFVPLFGPSLMLVAFDSPRWILLKGLSLVVAGVNILLLGGLIWTLARGRRLPTIVQRRERQPVEPPQPAAG